jgi:hypothetical protein
VLTVKDIKAGRETLTRPLTVGQSELVRDVLAKRIYQRVITFVQVILNRALCPPRGGDMEMLFWERVGAVKLLDMVPFEAFERSSFEHLCSNYYNEGINLQYQAFVARMEQQRVLNITKPVGPGQGGLLLRGGGHKRQEPYITVKMLEKQMAEVSVVLVCLFALLCLFVGLLVCWIDCLLCLFVCWFVCCFVCLFVCLFNLLV